MRQPKFRSGDAVVYIKGSRLAEVLRELPEGRHGRRYSIRTESGTTAAVREGALRHVGEAAETCWSPDCVTYHGPLGRDADGYLVYRVYYPTGGQMDTRVTECCEASAKGCDGYIGCRNCYEPIDELIGCQPTAPYTGESGNVTSTEVRGWAG